MSGWLTTRDPGLIAVRRAVRVTAATCVAFYLGRYLLQDATIALYAAFLCIALGALSDVTGRPRQRAVTMLLATAVGAVLVTVGTYLSVATLAATAGMLVVGFLVSFAGVGGPRLVGLANGWQLLYILPSFPPYDPASLGSRLLGLGLGLGCLLVADQVLLPVTSPAAYRDVLADAVEQIGVRLAVVRRLLAGQSVRAPELADSAARAGRAVAASRLSAQPLPMRPSGPSRSDRAFAAASSAVRIAAARVDDLQHALQSGEGPPRAHHGIELVRQAQQCLHQCAAALRGGDLPDVAALQATLTRTAGQRERWLVDAVAGTEPLDSRVAVGTTTIEVAEAARILALATTVGVSGQLPAGAEPLERRLFWFAAAGPARLWATRLTGQLTLRSVWFRNALRVAVALAVARALAGVLDLSHGFWVLLATLTLMRTTFSATRSAVGPALLGTLVGAGLAVPMLVVLGDDNVAMAVLLPVLILAALAGGPLLGPAFGQAGFTLTVAALFSQVSPASWSLAEWRILDVTVGAVIGVLAGLLAWPRGASGQLVARCRDALQHAVRAMLATTDELTGRGDDGDVLDGPLHEARKSLLFAGETVAFAMGEPVASGLGPHWRELLDTCRHMVEGGQYIRSRRQGSEPLPWSEASAMLRLVSADDAARAEVITAGLPALPTSAEPPLPDGLADWLRTVVTGPVAPPGVLDVIDARGWLVAVRRDLDRLATTTAQRHQRSGEARRRGWPALPGQVFAGQDTPMPPGVDAPYRAIAAGMSNGRRWLRPATALSSIRSAGTNQLTSNSSPSGSLAYKAFVVP